MSMKEQLFIVVTGAIIGLISYAFAQYLNHIFAKQRSKESRRNEIIAMAKLAKSELLNLRTHMDNNLEKLVSMLNYKNYGSEIDFQKLKFSESGLIAIKFENLVLLHGTIAQDILTLNLFSRNNEMEIESAINKLFSDVHCSEQTKITAITKLVDRFTLTIDKCNQLESLLTEYQLDPDGYTCNGSVWDKSLFSINRT
ncbi:hypothetical protein [Vibrio vulnificus]|uniref:hypothetical protein n=1 Tax=Vibrio vulnificus TaxID=672 RepID=UPI003242AD49